MRVPAQRAEQMPPRRSARRSPATNHAAHPALKLQQSIGNQRVQHLSPAHTVQPKLRVSRPDDPYEQEADRVADVVMRMPASDRETNDATCPSCAGSGSSCLKCNAKKKLLVQRRAAVIGPESPPAPDDLVSRLGSGHPLDSGARGFFETKFGRDFSDVRVHADSQADRSVRTIDALAFTAGRHIAFRTGHYQPHSPPGRRLLAHELTHTIQQGAHNDGRAAPVAPLQRQAAPPAADPGGGLSDEMLRQIARRLRGAMQGWGTDEDAIYAAMAGRTQAQVDAIARVYADMYGRVLLDDLRGELTEGEMRHLALFAPTLAPAEAGARATTLADMVAWQLGKAMNRIGTDEDAIYAALTGRTVDERRQIKDAYRRRVHRELEADLRSELSRAELTRALMLLNQGLLEPEDELYLAMAGLGTDEATVFRVLSSLAGDVTGLTNLEANYRRKYGDLVQDLRGDLSAGEYRRARSYILPTILDADVQDCGAGGSPAQTARSVREAHARAVWMHRFALTRSRNIADPAVQAAALRYFKITLPATTRRDAYFWGYVQRALDSLSAAEINATYECEPRQSLFHGFCISDNIGVTIFNIHLCPGWWTSYSSVDERAGILIHEWGHRFGTGVATIFETYCFDSDYASAPITELVTSPDAYMQFIWDLSIGSPAPCF